MKIKQSDDSFCQSCGLPLSKAEVFGTNTNGSKNNDYCRFCFQNGRFTEPNITMEQMIEKVVGFIVTKKRIAEVQAKQIAGSFIPKLKRWRTART